jgi:putative peptidoglycan lipid II flippase
MAKLIQHTPEGDLVHELIFQSTSIGRGSLNDIVIDDSGDRRLHAEVLDLGGGRYMVLDNHSRTGVWVNGERLHRTRELADGDEVRVGAAVLLFQAGEPLGGRAKPVSDRMGSGVLQLTLGTLLSRVLGWARELVAGAYFGLSSGLFDAYVAATTLPNLLRGALGEQAAEGAFMPAHRTLTLHKRDAEALSLRRSVLNFVLIWGTVSVLLGILFAPSLMVVIVPGFARRHPALLDTATVLTRIMMPYLLIIGIGAVFGSLLLSERRFLRYALAPSASSVVVIGSLVLLHEPLGIKSMAYGLVAGGMVQMLVCGLPYLRNWPWRRVLERPLVDARQPALRKVGRSVIPIGLASLLTRVGGIVDRILASILCERGSIAALYVAFRLVQLPFGVLGLAVGRAAFPSFMEQASSEQGRRFSVALVRALRLNAFLMLPASLVVAVLATPCVRLFYERGRFTAGDTSMAALALLCYGIGLVGMSARSVLVRGFYALLNSRTPFLMSVLGIALNIVLSVVLVRTPLRHGGLALATAMAAWTQAALLLFLLGKEMVRQERRLTLEGLWPSLARTGACGSAMALAMWGTSAALATWAPGTGFLANAAAFLAPSAVGGVAYLSAAWLLRTEELRELFQRLPRA